MLDRAAFIREMTLLHDRFGRTPNEHVIGRYYETLANTLTTDEFLQAARLVFDNDQYWPAPARFIEIVRGDPKSNAAASWRMLVRACADGPDAYAQLPADIRDAATALGGYRAIAYAEGDHKLARLERDFTRTLTERPTAQPPALPAGDVIARLP